KIKSRANYPKPNQDGKPAGTFSCRFVLGTHVKVHTGGFRKFSRRRPHLVVTRLFYCFLFTL
ncbi:MAG TPA: hypothetical protein VFE51_28885, partial [Verrucomicrobiae bacterium]|nr:hypothetical protein [Verrucomicrobiae bacterium]